MVKTRKLKSKYRLGEKPVLATTFRLFDIQYKKPTNKDLAVGLVYFNSSKSTRILMNYFYAREKLNLAGIPNYTLEMYIKKPELHDAFHVKTDVILFQKERLCHVLEKKIPKQFTKLLFMDCDVIFDRKNWYNDLSKMLDTYEIIHPFSKTCRLDLTYKKCLEWGDAIGTFPTHKQEIKMNPGYAWAFQRKWFVEKGLYQYAILGGGDISSARPWVKAMHTKHIDSKNYESKSMQEYISKVGDPKVGFLDGLIYHLFHGSVRNRQWGTRYEILKDYNDPRDATKETKQGILTIKNKTLKSKIQKYFETRDDDGVEE
jgi:hypothetical protein